jgi:hypothetical protein
VAAPLIVRLVMDAAGYLKTVDTAVASNTKLEESSLGVGEAMQVSANKSVAASLRATEALKTQIAGYRELAVSAEQSAAVRERAALLASKAEGRLNAQLGLAPALAGTSRAAQTAERDVGKTTRGLLAGSGAAAGLGRSLAFASTGFIAVAGGATLLKASISSALRLAATQRQVDAQLKTSGKSWDQYGQQIDHADLKLSHLSGFTNQELLQGFGYLVRENGNVSESLKLTAVAADVARGRNISLASAAIALAKAQGGSLTALKRLGIVIPANVKGMDALAFVAEKFAGQAKAGATVTDRFHASLVDTEEIIGTALLPTFTRLTTEAGDWLARMNETGRLQRDVNDAVSIGGTVFHTLGTVVGVVDKVTGSFKHTLELLLAIFAVNKVLAFGNALTGLATKWGLVTTAAGEAAVAESTALGGGAAGVAGRGGAPFIVPAGSSSVTSRVGQYTTTPAATRIGPSGAAAIPLAFIGSQADQFPGPSPATAYVKRGGKLYAKYIYQGKVYYREVPSIPGDPVITPGLINIGRGGNVGPSFFPNIAGARPGAKAGPFGNATPLAVYSQYTQTITEQLAVAQAGLTKGTKDDVAAAKRIIARIKRLIANGHLAGASLVQALNDEAAQQGVLDGARQNAAQQAAAIAAAKKAAASSYTTPIDLQLAEARSQLTTSAKDDIQVEKQILAAARAAIASGNKNKEGQLAALQVELQAKQALDSLQNQSSTTFVQPAKLQLALAKAQATGGNQTKILLEEKAALERALKSSKGNIQKQTDIYNQITAINQQLGADANAAFGQYRQASLAAETAGLGLTKAQRKALEARLSQRGPGGTAPGSGVGAGGFIIGPDGRPIQVHHHRRPHHGQQAGTDGGSRKLQATFNIRIYLDKRDITQAVTIEQQRTRTRNPPQRRGPHAGRQA